MKTAGKFVVLALMAATVMFATSCGGNAGKKKSAEEVAQGIVDEVVEKAGIKAKKTKDWPDNEYTKQLSKPEIDIKIAGTAEMGGTKMFSVTFVDGTTKEQIKECVERVKSDGFTNNASESDGGDAYYMYNATNDAGYDVMVSWAPSAAGLMVSK
jgi:hypothetical protein